MGSEPLSRIEKILSNIIGEGSYELELPLSDAEEILQAILNDTTTNVAARDRMCEILLCILNNEEYTGETLSRAEEILKCISQGEKYEVDEWTYEHVLSRVEQLLTDWANKEDPTYTKTVSGLIVTVLDAIAEPAISLKATIEPKQEATPFVEATTTEPYLSKTASTTGNKRYLDKIVGGTVAWNQIVQNGDFSDGTNHWQALTSGVTISASNNILTVERTSGNSSTGAAQKGNCLANHVYLCTAEAKKVSGDNFIIRYMGLTSYNTIDSESWQKANQIVKSNESGTNINIVYIRYSGANIGTANVRNVQITDLTHLFSNAPAIADYVYSLEQAPEGAGVQWLKDYGFIDDTYRAYNPEELISAKPTAFTVGSNTYALGGVDLRGLFKLDAQNNLYCDGDIYPPSGQISEKYGIVNLGLLDWIYVEDGSYFRSSAPDNSTAPVSSGNPNILQAKYTVFTGTLANFKLTDKTIYYGATNMVSSSSRVGIRDSSYSDATTFKTAMNGVYLIYPLATPTTSTSESYPNPVDIENGDTEAFIDSRVVPIPCGHESQSAGEYAVQGKTGLTVNHAQTQADTPTTYSVTFTEQGTVYGGTMDIVSGELSMEWAEIAFYAGETLPGRWLSSKDEYAEGTTPTTGAQVVYELAEPITYQLSPTQVTMFLGENTLWTEDGEITLTYIGTNPAMMMQSLRAQNNILKKQGLKPIEKPLDPIKPIIKKYGGDQNGAYYNNSNSSSNVNAWFIRTMGVHADES